MGKVLVPRTINLTVPSALTFHGSQAAWQALIHNRASPAAQLHTTSSLLAGQESITKRSATKRPDDPKSKDKGFERDLFLSVLSATTTKRDAKSYLSQFKPGKSPVLSDQVSIAEPVHVSLVGIRATQELDDSTLEGLANTFIRLHRLGLNCVVVVDAGLVPESSGNAFNEALDQADRLVSAFTKITKSGARRLDQVLGLDPTHTCGGSVAAPGPVKIIQSDFLRSTLNHRMVAVLPTIAYTTDLSQKTLVRADDVLLALTRHFAGLTNDDVGRKMSPVRVDRIVLLDPLGGLPSSSDSGKGHLFVNLEQEFHEIMTDLRQLKDKRSHSSENQYHERHLQNLGLINDTLSILPPSSSALLTTPYEAATSTAAQKASISDLGVQTRRPKNPLIYNLLTDKPLISSSLPASRLNHDTEDNDFISHGNSLATFIKRGMPLSMIPNPRELAWVPPSNGTSCFNIDDPRIDFPRLLNLIEDSFNRPLDVEKYLSRIRNKTAGVIIAGEYEGGAILTWELPPGVADDGSDESRSRMVPYLDKFAVLKRSQGAGGVADIVFSCMVRTCFPNGVCWRSRKDNPVNKWYFERAVGTHKIPDSNWTMFWTTEGLLEDEQSWNDYEGVCRTIQPSWADGAQGDS